MNINCHVPGHESKELSVATSENNTVVGMYVTGFFCSAFWKHDPTPKIGNFSRHFIQNWEKLKPGDKNSTCLLTITSEI